MHEQTWAVGIFLFSLMQSVGFFKIAYRAKVLSAFGKTALTGGSLVYLTLIAVVPVMALLLVVDGPFDFLQFSDFGVDVKLANASLLSALHIGNLTLMDWFALGIKLPIESE